MKKAKRAILWFRNDLRLHDNEALSEALKTAEEIYPVYIFDERTFLEKLLRTASEKQEITEQNLSWKAFST